MSSFSVPLLPLVLCVVAIIGLLVPKPPSDSNARMDRISNVAYIDTFMSITEVREAFKHCGRMLVEFLYFLRIIHPYMHTSLGIYHWRSCTLNANRNHFFLEFVEKASVEHARALQIFQTKVYFLSHTPQLITHFESIAPTNYSSMLGVKRESTEDLQKPVGPPRVPAAAKRQQQQQQAGHSNTLPGVSCTRSSGNTLISTRRLRAGDGGSQYPKAIC